MLVDDLFQLTTYHHQREHSPIMRECSRYLVESNHQPLYKVLPRSYSDIHKVKVRFKNVGNKLSTAFNQAFEQDIYNLTKRAVFTSPSIPSVIEEDMDLFYIIPVDGYKFLYSKEVKNSNTDYASVLDTLVETFEDNAEAIDVLTQLLKYSYITTELQEGIAANAEIILHGIPYYYAIRVSAYPDYSILLNNINNNIRTY